MPLSLNEIRSRAIAFSQEWKNEASEDAEAKTFWDQFFNIFGIPRRRVASFEHRIPKQDGRDGYIDLLWKGTLLVEHKSRGKDLSRAYKQATDYFPGLKDHELPKYIIVCDFDSFKLYNLDEGTEHEFRLEKLVDNLHLFDFLSGYKRHTFKDQDPVNIAAAEMMGRLHDELKSIGYEGHQLELYLVRLLFLLFADDTNIFEKGIFYELIDSRTKEDGSDLAGWLQQLFEVLNTPEDKRFKNLDESLKAFPYVNGKLFEERLSTASFDSKMRKYLLDCCALDWSAISPAIFGSLFQSVMDEKARRNLGAHYTSEKNIMKVIQPLFLDEHRAEFEKVKHDSRKLDNFHTKLSKLRFLDPACGCGNFLIVAYRELRMLEIDVLKAKFKNQMATNIDAYINVNVDQFYGIEYEEFPAQIAQVAMWLMDHQMNIKVSEAFGEYFVRLPLKRSATIVHGNALRLDWQSLLDEKIPPQAENLKNFAPRFAALSSEAPSESIHSEERYDYILGNPPFIGKQFQTDEQKADMQNLFGKMKGGGLLDYVAGWYIKAAQYIANHKHAKTAFVSTNSISQGEQVGILWNEMFNNYKIKIQFAHRTFNWSNEARANAAVHVVIIGFGGHDVGDKAIYTYDSLNGEPARIAVKNINPYLVEGNDLFVASRKSPICPVPEITYGSMANDEGNLLLTNEEKEAIITEDPRTANFIRPFLGSFEFINNVKRWCIWLEGVAPQEYSAIAAIVSRINAVRLYREKSKREGTRKLAKFPMLFGELRQPQSKYLLIPGVSSESREYIPIGFLTPDVIVSDLARAVADADLFMFGTLTSTMHMTWMRYISGKLKSDYRYSNSLVYNNFPWPESPSEKQKEAVEKAAQAVLDARAQFPDASLADLYDPNTMPPVLVKAHQQLDKAVDLCYRPQPFPSETKRIEYLFELYDKYTSGLFVEEKKGKKR